MTQVSQHRIWLVPGVLLASGMLLTQAGSSAAPAPPPAFTSTVTVAPAAKVGKPAAFSVSLVDKSAAVPGGNVDLEVFNAQNKRVAQQVWSAQTLAAHKSSVYHWAWKPAAAGVYTVKLGVFSGDWKTLRYWVDKAQTVKVS